MKALRTALCVGAFFAALGYAGHMDYEDAVVCEMKNNGAYWELSEKNPQLTDGELVEIYERQRDAE